MKLFIVITAFLLFTIGTGVRSQPVQFHIKVEILPELKELFRDMDIEIWVLGDSTRNEKISFRDSMNIQVTTDSCWGFLLQKYVDTGAFRRHYSLYCEVDCIPGDTIKNLLFQFPKDCQYNRRGLNNTCPKCRKKDKVIPIWYGLLVPMFDEQGNLIRKEYERLPGGCVVSDCDPGWYCKRDKYRF